MPVILALDTSEARCSVALRSAGQDYSRSVHAPQQQTQNLLPLIDQVLEEAGIRLQAVDAIAFARGPGSFTGVRIAAAAAQALALGLSRPVIPVSTLLALAQTMVSAGSDSQRVAVALDARMDQIYWGCFAHREGTWVSEGAECVVSPDVAPLPEGEGWIGGGSGWDRHGPRLAERFGTKLTRWLPGQAPEASAVLKLALEAYARGGLCRAGAALPVYLRDRVT